MSDSPDMAKIAPANDVTIHVTPDAIIPDKATSGVAGWDCRANQTLTIEPGQNTKVDIGLCAAIPAGWCILLHS